MKIAISGASGFLGTALRTYFENREIAVVSIPRSISKESLMGVDVVINLAGASIARPWTSSYRQKILDSRIQTTAHIVDTINAMDLKPKLLISASAIGYYSGGECSGESNGANGDDFMAKICKQWEMQANRVSPSVRLVVCRMGVVVSPDGGVLPRLSAPIKHGIAIDLGNPKAPLAWLSLTDFCRAIEFIIDNHSLYGVVNLAQPSSSSVGEILEALRRIHKIDFGITLPRRLLRIQLGKYADLLTFGQCVIPYKLLHVGFVFKDSNIKKLLYSLSHEIND